MKKIFAAAMAVITAAVMAGCSVPGGSSDDSDYQSPALIDDVNDTGTSAKAEEMLADTSDVKSSETEAETEAETRTAAGVTVNGNAVSLAEFAYTYDEAYGHYLTASYIDDSNSNVVIFMAVLPEDACVSGAEYSGNSIAANGILFGCMVIAQDFSYANDYNSSDNPECFDDLRVRINSIDLYNSADYEIAGNVAFDEYSARISASGHSEYKEAESGGSGGGGYDGGGYDGEDSGGGYSSPYIDDTCKYCNGSGRCYLCKGLGYTTWGGFSNPIDCSSCEGLGDCYYCQGTGKQVYVIRGVPIS